MKAILALILAAGIAGAAEISVQWDMPTTNTDGTPLTDLAGARIYYGTASSNYTATVDAGMVESLSVTGLTAGATYYFNGTAYNTAGLESDFCTEVAKVAGERGAIFLFR